MNDLRCGIRTLVEQSGFTAGGSLALLGAMPVLALGLTMAASLPVQAGTESSPNAAEAFERHLAAMGGRAALNKITTVVFKGSFQERNQTLSQELHLKAPGVVHWVLSLPDGRSVRMGKNSKGVCWRRSFNGIIELQNERGHLLSHLISGLAPFGQLRLAEPTADAVCEQEQRDGRQFVSVRSPSGSFAAILFDAQSRLIAQIGEISLDDYREVEGLKLPFRIRLGPNAVITVKEITLNPPLEDAQFEIPEGNVVTGDRESSQDADPLHGNFDSHTRWPSDLPAGFDPARLLEDGKNPGLGIRGLHQAGIDGRGVGIAIIDQPLLKDHQEYARRLVRYEAIDTEDVLPLMHGPAVASIAVGQTCGVAPNASLYFFAVPTWKWTENQPWAELLTRIIELNGALKDTDKIRVVSVSLGAFSERRNFKAWQEAVNQAERHGILVVTCDQTFLRIGTLRRLEGKSPDNASHFERNRYYHSGAAIWVPAANRTIASQKGPDVFTYERTGGMSWTVPYMAGLAALAYQIHPALEPNQVVQLWLKTATKTDAGAVINPSGFIEKARKLRAKHPAEGEP